jgi:glycosyltransferase involved in cell wall biosynthesis
MGNFLVSVIIPVYNAEKYIASAVLSALEQQETGEIILIEDGSPDKALAVCQELESAHEKVKLLRHPNGENRGAGASRNLGIQKAQFDYIAFLDADDFMCNNRFAREKVIFEQNPLAEGVYASTGVHFETPEAQLQWEQRRGKVYETTVKKLFAPEELAFTIINCKFGYFSTDAIVVKKSVFQKIGYFDTDLKLSQDTALWIKLSIMARLFPGSIDKPVAMRRVHAQNRILSNSHKVNHYFILLYKKTINWALSEPLAKPYLPEMYSYFLDRLARIKKVKYGGRLYHWWYVSALCPRLLTTSMHSKQLLKILKSYING